MPVTEQSQPEPENIFIPSVVPNVPKKLAPKCIEKAEWNDVYQKDEDEDATLIPELQKLHAAIDSKAKEFADVIKIGRTHLQDATPMTVGQEFGGWANLIERDIERLKMVLPGLILRR